jgi:hypothetical protein
MVAMTDTSFQVDAGATRFKRGAQDGVTETRTFRITAPGPSAAEIAAMQLLTAGGSRRRETVKDAWAKAARAEQLPAGG